MREDVIKIKDWGADRPTPLIVQESIFKHFHKAGQISDEAMEALENGDVVYISGYWTVMSRLLKANP